MGYDRGDSHYDDAGSWEKACRHISLFLWWAAEHGLASDEHDLAEIREAPTAYFIERCDTKLWDDDLNDRGIAFAKAEYDAYLREVTAYAKRLGIGDYEIPENDTTKNHFFAWLDARLREHT